MQCSLATCTKLLPLQHVGRKLPLLVLAAPYRFGFYSATFNHCHDSCCCSTCHLHIRTHSHTLTHTRTLTERVCGAAHDGCVRRVYIGATWRGSQPTTAIHVAYIARRIYTAAWGEDKGGLVGLRATVELVVSFVGRLTGDPRPHPLAFWPESAYNVARFSLVAEPGFVSVSLTRARESECDGSRQ